MGKWIERSMLLGLGVFNLTRDKVARFVDRLVEEGEVRPEEAPSVVDRLVARGEEEREELRKLMRQELDRMIPVSRQDIEELNRKIDELAARVEGLAGRKRTTKQAD